MPLGQAIFRIMLDLNPSVYVIIYPCCPQMLKKWGRRILPVSESQIKPASSLRSPPRQARKPGLNGPLRGDIYPDTGGIHCGPGLILYFSQTSIERKYTSSKNVAVGAG